jgi:hypothetical protein
VDRVGRDRGTSFRSRDRGGRPRYIVAAELAAVSSRYVNMDDWCGRRDAFWVASASAAAILLIGLATTRLARALNRSTGDSLRIAPSFDF